MRSTVVILMIAATYAYYQVSAEDVYIAELMVESNVTLEAQVVLEILNGAGALEVTGSGGGTYTVTLTNNTLIAECVVIGDETSCNCSAGYIWSNEVCNAYNCCRETTCKQNVSMITPLCVAKVQIRINGSVIGSASWDNAKSQMVKDAFENLNGLESVNVTPLSTPDKIAIFETNVSVKFDTSKLQELLNKLESSLSARVAVDTLGMVNIDVPKPSVCYESTPVLRCTFEEATGSSGWNMSRPGQRFELNNGAVVELIYGCGTTEYPSCVEVKLHKLKGVWEGTYECGFTSGSIRHTAKDFLKVALLPDTITMEIDPLVADCTKGSQTTVTVTAKVLTTNQSYEIQWTPKEVTTQNNKNTKSGDFTVYTTEAVITCDSSDIERSVDITFKNERSQRKTGSVKIPILNAKDNFCKDETIDGLLWPKTPAGETVISRTCSAGRVGSKSRICGDDGEWEDVFSECINQELNQVNTAAQDFLNGLGATQEVAMNIFEGLVNSSKIGSAVSGDSTADISASINILNTMASATVNISISEEVFPNFVSAASNMLNSNWSGVNDTVRHDMSAKYIDSVEGLVKNIKINNSRGFNSSNLDLKFCSSSDCNISVFDIGVNLNKSSGIMKTVAVKNLMNKFRKKPDDPDRNPLLLSTTLENRTDSNIVIKMDFPNDPLQTDREHSCVFWDPTSKDWSKEGCSVKKSDNTNRTVCVCNHLTSFSTLMAKTDVSNPSLDIITYVGLGVSICSLLIFLIVEALVWSAVAKSNLSHFRHTSVVNIAMFRLLADCSFLASIYPDKLSDSMCLAFTVCKHLFYLAMFCWMLCLSIMLVHQLIFVFSPLRKRVFMFLSSIVGYICPMVIVGSSYVYCKYTGKDYYIKGKCWLVYTKILDGSLHAFLLPAGTIILTNLFSMVVVIVTLTKSSVSDSKSDDKDTAKSILKVVVFLTPVFGVTWIIGYFVFSLEPSHAVFPFVNYSFTILNSFQGLFIFLTGCFGEQKVREELMKLITGKSKGNTDSTKNLTSTTYTKDR